MALFLRYRQGTRVDIEADPFENLNALLERVGTAGSPLEFIREHTRYEIWDTRRPAAESTWFALLEEFFEIHREEDRQHVWPFQIRLLEGLAGGGEPHEIWSRILPVFVANLEVLSGWLFSPARWFAEDRVIHRAEDGAYYMEDGQERIEVIGGRTTAEAKLEYLAEDCVRKYGHLHRMCRLVALFCLHEDFRRAPGNYPTRIRVTLPEDSYLFYSWYHLSPVGTPRIPWRPPNRLTDPETLAIEILARYAERNPLPLPDTAPELTVIDTGLPYQYEEAIDTDLRFGEEEEATLSFQGRRVRWVNGSRSFCPVLIVGTHHHEAREERQWVAQFLSVLCYETNTPVVPVTGVVGPRRTAPMIRQPRKLADHLYPANWTVYWERPLSEMRRLALALYREGISSRSGYYQFLSLYKILQIRLPGLQVAQWINQHTDDNAPFAHRVRELREQGVPDLAEYLYQNWRNAIAHVGRDPQVNPDDLETGARISQDLPIIQGLARIMIESDHLN